MPQQERRRLALQERAPNTCCFVDTEHWRCSIYEARPTICRIFGYAPVMACQYAPLQATRMTDEEFNRQMEQNAAEGGGELGWITGITLDWSRIMRDMIIGGQPKRNGADITQITAIERLGKSRFRQRLGGRYSTGTSGEE